MSKNSHARKARPAQRAPSKHAEPLPVQLIPLTSIDPSTLNRGTGSLDDLVPSVREHGVQQPIKLRPKGDRFEIVYGERRFRAAKKVGLAAIPATVEKLTDDEAHELRIIENACREDPHPLEEAEAYEKLLAMKDARGDACHTVDTLAKLVGRSAQYVYGRLKLTALGPAMRKAFRGGELTVTTAFLIARAIPPDLQDEALAEFRQVFAEEGDGAPFPADDLAYHVEQNYLMRLERAPFSLKDARLVPEAGPCTSCPKRSGNQPRLFSDEISKDACSDRTCFRTKLEAHRERLGADVVAKGGIVLTEQQSNEIYRGTYQLPWNSKHVDVDARCMEDPSGRIWRELLGDLCPKLALATDPGGVPHALAVKSEALSALKQAGVDLARIPKRTATHGPATGGGDGGHPTPVDPATERAAAKLRNATIANILGAITAAAESRPADDDTFARLVFESMTRGGYHDAISDTVKRRDLPRAKGELPETTLAAHARSLDPKGLRALVLELSLARGAYFSWATSYPERLTMAADAYGIDIAAIEKRTAGDLEAKCAERSSRKVSPAPPTAAE